MTLDFVLDLGKQAMLLTLLIASPVLLLGLLVGVLVSILQSVTQIQEMTLTFVPKLIVTVLSLIFFGPWMMGLLMNFTIQLFNLLPGLSR